MPSDKRVLRVHVQDHLEQIKDRLNLALKGEALEDLKSVIERLGRGGKLPHWYEQLEEQGALPNLDGKTIGSVLEMLLVAILETAILNKHVSTPLRVNPARGVDLPDLDLGVKSPSTNYCTSEPFFSPYERLLGNEHDCLVLLTDYQEAKRRPPLRLQVTSAKYLKGSQMADRKLCDLARSLRGWLLGLGDAEAQRAFCFLAYVNQSDWRAKKLLSLLERAQSGDAAIGAAVRGIVEDAHKKNNSNKSGVGLIPLEEIDAIGKVLHSTPHHIGLLRGLDNWVTDALKDAARLPNANEWRRLVSGALDGQIGMSFALQWRYNFAYVFGANEDAVDKQIQRHDEFE